MNIAVIGTGYVGLVTGTCFAETGNNVVCVDIDEAKVKKLKKGIIPIYEPGLELLFERNSRQGRLTFTTSLAKGIKDAEIIFLALPTPPGGDGSADLSYVLGVAKELSFLIEDYKVIVDKSTVPVGTAEKVHAILAENLDEELFDVVSNPEFLREGVAVEDFMKPDRVVIGASSQRARGVMRHLYEPFVRQGNPIFFMDERSAEMTKYAANSYLATRISFMNEIANLCEMVGADVDMVRLGMGSDSRIGKRFLFPGVGYGGSCFPKDVQALALTAKQTGYDFKILNSVMKVNQLQKEILAEKIIKYFDGNIAGKTIAIWGLAFKPNTDDVREAPSLAIIPLLQEEGAKIAAYDPAAMEEAAKELDDVEWCESSYDVCKDADVLVIITEWNEFRALDLDRIADLMKEKRIVDLRNIYKTSDMEKRGFHYLSIGRREVKPPAVSGLQKAAQN